MKNRLTLSIAVGMILGVIVGYACHTSISDPVTLKTVAGYFSIVTDIFLRLIKMIIAPLGLRHARFRPGRDGQRPGRGSYWPAIRWMVHLCVPDIAESW